MRTSQRIGVALAAWLMLMIGAGGTLAQASPAPGATATAHSHSSAQVVPRFPLGLPVLARGFPVPAPPLTSPPPICPTDAIQGAPTELPARPLQIYFLGDPRLGPAFLPQTGAVGELLRSYQRLDSFLPGPFISCFWDRSPSTVGWRFPKNRGFADGFKEFSMVPDQVIDRFGSNMGTFFSPFGVPFTQRALPPSSLDTLEPRYPFSYHVFRVLKSFTVQAGIAAPWFGQPGGGFQYRSLAGNADDLIRGGFLQPLN